MHVHALIGGEGGEGEGRGSLLHNASIFELVFTINEAGEVRGPERTTHTSANPSLSCTSISELLSKSAAMAAIVIEHNYVK